MSCDCPHCDLLCQIRDMRPWSEYENDGELKEAATRLVETEPFSPAADEAFSDLQQAVLRARELTCDT